MRDTEQAALAVLESTPAILRQLLGRLPADILVADLDRGWSPKKLLAHMVDVEAPAFAERLHAIIEQGSPVLASIDVMARLDSMGWEGIPTDGLLSRLESARAETCVWLAALTTEQLQQKARHETAGDLTASNLLHYWATHDLAHLRGIQRMLYAVLNLETGGIGETMDV